tara:strand:+ start:333 stop:518 length:186 start_codon:yes stop_codon:yes gene_type:complete
MWGWIKPLIEALLTFLEKKASAPRTIEDANTPKVIRDRWASYLRKRLHPVSDKDSGPGQPK